MAPQQPPPPILQTQWGHQSYVTQWIPPPGCQPSSSLSTGLPGYHHPLSLIPCLYSHQCQHPQVLTCQNIISPDDLHPDQPQPNSTSAPKNPSQSGASPDQEPHNDDEADKGLELLSTTDFSGVTADGQSFNATDPGGPSAMSDEMYDLEQQENQERLERRRREIYEARRKYALEKNLAAFEIVRRRYMLPSGQPMLKILGNGKEVDREEDEGDTTDYDSDEDDGEDNDDEEEIQRYSNFVQAVGCSNEHLDSSEHKILSAYLSSYLLSRLEYARARRFDMRLVRTSMAEKILLSIKNQKRISETWTWSSRRWSREMNEAILHHKKTDSLWKARVAVLDDRLAKSWQENVEGARRDLDSRAK
ncbi:hypothetical protein BG015_007711 [Linnemannia schmuckeri]|uniref:Uncharacterized protein n=1 Tax=Linnemannia schmuckeri TaxID=64567 RepID=A0A9P5RY32_9FUNG|nr:hypothetical protein BG015_007711 [Linnemannia schmuckeri]